MSVFSTRHWQTSGRLVQELNVCTVGCTQFPSNKFVILVEKLLINTSTPLFYTFSAINFYLYCISGKKFRDDLSQLLRRVCGRAHTGAGQRRQSSSDITGQTPHTSSLSLSTVLQGAKSLSSLPAVSMAGPPPQP